MTNINENELFDDIEIVEEEKTKKTQPKERIIDKVYQYRSINISDDRGEYYINPVLDDNNKTIIKYTTSSLIVYDDNSLKHFKDRLKFKNEKDGYQKLKYIYQYKDVSENIKANNIQPVRFTLPSINSYNKKLLAEDLKSFKNPEHNKLHSELSKNINTIWEECDVFSQYFKDVIQTFFYGKIYKYTNLNNEELITNSKIILFEVKNKAFFKEWNDKIRLLKESFKNIDDNSVDEYAVKDYLKELFSRKVDTPKNKIFKLFYSKVSENPKSKKPMQNDYDCDINYINKNNLALESRIIKEDDFYYDTKENIDGEWVDKKEKITLDLSNLIPLDYVYNEDTKKSTAIKFDNTKFDSDWYKLKIAESNRIINKYKDSSNNEEIEDTI